MTQTTRENTKNNKNTKVKKKNDLKVSCAVENNHPDENT